jgi:hypothetical protein
MKSEQESKQDKREQLANKYSDALVDIGGHGSAIGAFAGQAVNLSLEHNMSIEESMECLLSARKKVVNMANKAKNNGIDS